MTYSPPPMRLMTIANDHIGSRKKLAKLMDDCGYLYFKKVLDLDAVSTARDAFIEVLSDRGLVDSDDPAVLWNGVSLGDLSPKGSELIERRVWEYFVADPNVERFFSAFLGEKTFWVPTAEYRVVAPMTDGCAEPFATMHQDGFYNPGIPFQICWIPLVETDANRGGLAIAEGMHRSGYLHDTMSPPLFMIPPSSIPADAWCRGDYEPGDVVIFDIKTPHCGLPNSSKGFRLSMDVRVMPATGQIPAIGRVVESTPALVVIERDTGGLTSLNVDEETYVRGLNGTRLANAELPVHYPPGSRVMAAYDGRKALVVRPPR